MSSTHTQNKTKLPRVWKKHKRHLLRLDVMQEYIEDCFKQHMTTPSTEGQYKAKLCGYKYQVTTDIKTIISGTLKHRCYLLRAILPFADLIIESTNQDHPKEKREQFRLLRKNEHTGATKIFIYFSNKEIRHNYDACALMNKHIKYQMDSQSHITQVIGSQDLAQIVAMYL